MQRFLFILLFLFFIVSACDDDIKTLANTPESEYIDNGVLCDPLLSDFSPGADDSWPACASADTGIYERFSQSISTIARVASFETIATLLFDPTKEPSSDDFTEARLEYQIDEGLDSRVTRRYDPHFIVPQDTNCGSEGTPELYPDYCVGPSHLQPLLLDALNAGIAGQDPRQNAARVEAGLLWFLYVSPFKESLTCTDKAADCDSSFAYFTGAENYCAPDDTSCTSSNLDERSDNARGFARYVQSLNQDTYNRAWNGLLAVHCWRENDNVDGVATDITRRDLARTQYDRALLRGVVDVLKHRVDLFLSATGNEKLYYWSFIQTLGPVLYPAAQNRSEFNYQILKTELDKTSPDTVDVAALTDALDNFIACP
ncbi:MAG: hypothetical protein IPJ88_03805 [Myxococcales bacterium]|nr:MAG: hypothetical protein IPJ88_03805 [Myxococcales bacterium]